MTDHPAQRQEGIGCGESERDADCAGRIEVVALGVVKQQEQKEPDPKGHELDGFEHSRSAYHK